MGVTATETACHIPSRLAKTRRKRWSMAMRPSIMLQLKASPGYGAVSEETYVLLAEYDRFDHFGRRVDHQQRFCDGLVQGSQTSEVIGKDVSQRRAVATLIRLVPFVIQAQYLRFIFCLRVHHKRSGILRRHCIARHRSSGMNCSA